MEGVEDIPGAALAEGIDWQWEHFPRISRCDRAQAARDRCRRPCSSWVRCAPMCSAIAATPTIHRTRTRSRRWRRSCVRVSPRAHSVSRRRGPCCTRIRRACTCARHLRGLRPKCSQWRMAMKGLSHGVYEIVSDHLGDDDEWSWLTSFARATGLPVTLSSSVGRRLRRQQDVQPGRGSAARRYGHQAADRRTPDRHSARAAVEFSCFRRPSDMAQQTG